MEAHPGLPEEDRRALPQPEDQGRAQEQRAQDHEPDGGAGDVDQALDDEPERALPVRDEGAHEEALELLLVGDRQQPSSRVERDPHGLALIGSEPGHRVQPVRGGRRQADRDLVDDPVVEDRLDLLEAAQDRPGNRAVRLVGSGQMADDPDPEGGRLSIRSAKSWASVPVPTMSM